MDRGTRRGRAESRAVHVVHGQARDMDVVKTVLVESSGTEASRVGCSGAGSAKDLEASMPGGGRTRVDTEEVAWRPRGDGRFGWFGPQNHRRGRFSGLGLKTGGESGVAGAPRRRARGTIVKLASRRSEVVKVACPSDASKNTWTKMPLRGRLS